MPMGRPLPELSGQQIVSNKVPRPMRPETTAEPKNGRPFSDFLSVESACSASRRLDMAGIIRTGGCERDTAIQMIGAGRGVPCRGMALTSVFQYRPDALKLNGSCLASRKRALSGTAASGYAAMYRRSRFRTRPAVFHAHLRACSQRDRKKSARTGCRR